MSKNVMINTTLEKIHCELEAGMQLPKCQKCGCMRDGLKAFWTALPGLDAAPAKRLRTDLTDWLAQMQPARYPCLGCDHCYPAVAQNLLTNAFPHLELPAAACEFQVNEASWPPVAGDYMVLNRSAPVAVTTLASVALADTLAALRPDGVAIVGKTETENIGIDKIIKNMITNPALRYLVVCGVDSKGHQTGQTLLALAQYGIDGRQRVIGSPGKRPVLRNVTPEEVERFRDQVQVVDKIGCQDASEIATRIQALLAEPVTASCGCGSCCQSNLAQAVSTVKHVAAIEPDGPVKLDRAGYFVIMPLADKRLINVEYYGYDHTLRQVVEGRSAREIYLTLIERGWVTELSHAAYLGKELAKAEMSLAQGFKYVQDGA